MGLRMRVHDKEPIGQALKRFKKLVERSGMQKELRAHQYYEKPCEQRRRAQLRRSGAVAHLRALRPGVAGAAHQVSRLRQRAAGPRQGEWPAGQWNTFRS